MALKVSAGVVMVTGGGPHTSVDFVSPITVLFQAMLSAFT